MASRAAAGTAPCAASQQSAGWTGPRASKKGRLGSASAQFLKPEGGLNDCTERSSQRVAPERKAAFRSQLEEERSKEKKAAFCKERGEGRGVLEELDETQRLDLGRWAPRPSQSKIT